VEHFESQWGPMLFIMVSKSCQNCLKYLLIAFTALHTV